MKSMRWIAAALLLLAGPALAQTSLLQGGQWNSGHVPLYSSPGGSQPVVQDSGTAAGGGPGVGLSELGLTVRGTGTAPYANAGTGPFFTNLCDYDAPTTNPTGYHYLCLSPNAQGGGLIVYGAAGGASNLPLTFNVNGTSYAFPFVVGGIVGPGTTVSGDVACWNNTAGTLLKDCGAFPVNAGTTNQLAWYSASGSVVSGLATANNGVLVTSAGGVPSIGATIPSSVTVANTVIQTTATGTNAIALAPLNVTVSSYTDQQQFSFVAANTSSGAVTVNVNSVGAGALYLPNGTTQVTNKMIVAGQFYTVARVNALSGFVLNASLSRPSTIQVFTSGSGTYTTPPGAIQIKVRAVGGGGAGSGSGTGGGTGSTGSATTFDTLTANGGGGGVQGGNSSTGGTASGGDVNLTGGSGQGGNNTVTNMTGGQGGSSAFGGNGGGASGGNAGRAAAANTGSGGGGAFGDGATSSGAGGAAGGYLEKLINTPATTYAYSVGSGGVGGVPGAGGNPGGAGGSGIIIVEETYR